MGTETQSYQCTAITAKGRRCRNCIRTENVAPSLRYMEGQEQYFLFCPVHYKKEPASLRYKKLLGSPDLEPAEPPVYLDTSTCYLSTENGEDAIYDATECAMSKQRKCLLSKDIQKPDVHFVTMADSKYIRDRKSVV